MEKQIVYNRWLEIDGDNGTDFVPFDVVFCNRNSKTTNPTADDVKDYTENSEVYSIEIIDGYGARLSMPEYMDCTEWAVFETEQKAIDYLETMYGDDD